jgi:hypothetical protein
MDFFAAEKRKNRKELNLFFVASGGFGWICFGHRNSLPVVIS